MSEHENGLDNAGWQHPNPDQILGTPNRDSSVIDEMLKSPQIPLPDGTFYQHGGFDAFGSNYLDAEGKPIIKIGSVLSDTAEMMREINKIQDEIVALGFRTGQQ